MKQSKKLYAVWNLVQVAEVFEIPLKKLESALATWFKQETTIDGNVIRVRACKLLFI
jgi:hypothetical protein